MEDIKRDNGMTDEEMIEKFKEIQQELWVIAAESKNVIIATFVAALIRQFEIPSPSGDSPDEA